MRGARDDLCATLPKVTAICGLRPRLQAWESNLAQVLIRSPSIELIGIHPQPRWAAWEDDAVRVNLC
jgi:hypothetical protein